MKKRTGIIVGFVAAFFLATVSCGVAGETKNPPNWGQRKEVTFKALKKDFGNPDMIYAPFIFWFWDEPLNPAKMAEMSRVMCSQGYSPGYAHGRNNMVGLPSLPGEEWLGEKWFSSFDAALKEAEKQKNYLGYCDEYWWPSFQAHGRVLKQHPELKAESLNWQVIDAAGGTEVKVPASFFAVAAQMKNVPGDQTVLQVVPGEWIWHKDGKENAHTCWFNKSFEIPKDRKVVKAVIKLSADNEFMLFVNGKKIGGSKTWMELTSFDVTEAVSIGKNVMAVRAGNIDGPFGLIAGMAVKLDDGKSIDIRSDSSWLCSLTIADGWECADFDAKGWTPAVKIADYGSEPWSVIKSESNASNPTQIYSKTIKLIGAGEPFSWKVPQEGAWRVYAFNKFNHPGAFDGQKCNSIDERLAPAFIKIALEPYAARYGGRMGKSIPGDFIDHEGDYGWKLAWSESLDRRFKENFGTDIRLSLPLMVDEDVEGLYAKARWQWFEQVSDLYAGVFRAITDWHEKRGMYTTAHVWEEGLPPQVSCVGDHMKFLRAITMPGQDCLGRKALRVHDFKEIESVAEFQNVRAATELMGAGGFEGKPWGTFNPSFLKQAMNAVTAWGMSHIIPHGVFTSRKLTGNPWPPDWYSENPMFPYMHIWNSFTRRVSYINSMGCAAPDVLLYNPLETAWINADVSLLDAGMWSMEERSAGGRRINHINKIYSDAITSLTDARIEFLVGDRFYVKQMEVKNGRLVRDQFEFSTVVLPPLDILTLDVAKKIVDFARAGGRVCALGELPGASAENGRNDAKIKELMDTLKGLPTFSACGEDFAGQLAKKSVAGLESPVKFVSGEFAALQHRRRIAGKDFFWLVNNTDKKQVSEVVISGVRGEASIWDCETGEVRPVSSADSKDGSKLKLVFKPLEAYWLVFDPKLSARTVAEEPELVKVMTVEGPWKVTCDPAIQPVMEYPSAMPSEFKAGAEKPLEDWKAWGPAKFSGLMDYTKTINVDKVEKRMFLDLGKVCHVAEVWVNGKHVGERLWGPYVFDVSKAIRPGKNEIHVRVANLINNSYGDIEESGLFGPVVLQKEQETR